MKKIILPLFLLVFTVGGLILIYVKDLSYIISFLWVVVMGFACIAYYLSSYITSVKVQIKPNKNIKVEGRLKTVNVEIIRNETRNVYLRDLYDGTITFSKKNKNNEVEYKTFTEWTDIQIKVKSDGTVGFANIQDGLTDFIGLTSNIPKQNKLIIMLLTILTIVVSVIICFSCYNTYDRNNKQTGNNLKQNIESISSVSLKDIDDPDVKYYYDELPDVNLIVITKDNNIFVNPNSLYNNPEEINTVLMFYEDNITAGRYDNGTGSLSITENDVYYNITELYMNIPIAVEENSVSTLHTLGELFGGIVEYKGMTEYDAVKMWFRDEYHIYIKSITEIPENVFSECYSTDISMGISLNNDFIKFMYYNYFAGSYTDYYTSGTKDMLTEKTVLMPPSLQANMDKIFTLIGITSNENNNEILMLDGDSIVAFGNSVRETGNDTYIMQKTDVEESLNVHTIIHSNWDIIMVNIFENITNMNNGMYQIFCENDNSQSFSKIKSSDSVIIQNFLDSLIETTNIIADDEIDTYENTKMNYSFFVRNLDLNLTSPIEATNIYLLNKPYDIKLYTNKIICHSLYYCLRQTKEMT
ncbi:MAG: hypothetical protein K2K89_13840 [Ruminococcus sp.]|nr:hypothetical protein [Ruminococcus sp.]